MILGLGFGYEKNSLFAVESIVDIVTSSFWALLAVFGYDSESEEEIRLALIEEKEREFHSWVRQQIVCLLILIFLYFFSYFLISRFKAKYANELLYSGEEDYFVYRISVWICTFSLAVSIGSVALLPFSVLGAELLQQYPDNYYLQWLSLPLISSMWNYVFVLSNLCLFVLLPFSYFFIESCGFFSRQSGVMQRVYETLSVCALLFFLIICITDLALLLINSSISIVTLTSLNLPLVYSCVSLIGVVLLLVSTPFGFAKMFTVISDPSARPLPFTKSEDLFIQKLEEKRLQSLEEKAKDTSWTYETPFSSPHLTSQCFRRREPIPNYRIVNRVNDLPALAAGDAEGCDCEEFSSPLTINISNSALESGDCDRTYASMNMRNGNGIWRKTESVNKTLTSLVIFWFWVTLRDKSLKWYQQMMMAVKYPMVVLTLLVLTGVALLMVVINSLKLMFGYRSLPMYVQFMEVQTRHTFGLVGVLTEIVIILYVMATSIVGVYSLPFVKALRPKWGSTPLTTVIINCSLVLVLSSALPVLANMIGITTFDLLGAYSSLEWLRNFRLILAYNVIFASASITLLVTQITAPMRRKIMKRLALLRCRRISLDDSFPLESEKLD